LLLGDLSLFFFSFSFTLLFPPPSLEDQISSAFPSNSTTALNYCNLLLSFAPSVIIVRSLLNLSCDLRATCHLAAPSAHLID
jgi:hypothetical protein